jgi:hypothetical protein
LRKSGHERYTPSKSREEMLGRTQLCFAAGAAEIWLCDDDENMESLASDSVEPINESRLRPRIPAKVELD